MGANTPLGVAKNTTLAAMIVQGEKGLVKIVSALQRSVPGVRVELGAFTLSTTRRLAKAGRDRVTAWRQRRLCIPHDIGEGMSVDMSNASLSYQLHVVAGIAWVGKALEDDNFLHRLWTERMK